jgi:glycosyltransferase involved in cell wall biosynthesis
MRKAKAVILPSEWEEPFGRVLTEAIGNGTIAMGSDRGGIPEVLGYNEAYIFHSKDVPALRSRIERVLDMSPSVYMEEVSKLQKTIVRFTDDVYADNWERFFLQQLRTFKRDHERH